MSEIIFARPRHNYDSYTDLYSLINLSGFKTVYFDEIDTASDNVYIATMVNGENEAGWRQNRARIILWDLEWRDEKPQLNGVSEVWASDRWYANKNGCKYVPMGSHKGLQPNTANPMDDREYLPTVYDVAYLGYMIPRRQQIQHDLRVAGVAQSPQGAWGVERDLALHKSKMYLHVHQHDNYPAVPSLRLVLSAAYRLPFVTEMCSDAGRWNDVIIQVPYVLLAREIKRYAQDDCSGMLTAFGNAAHYALCDEWTFRKSVEWAI